MVDLFVQVRYLLARECADILIKCENEIPEPSRAKAIETIGSRSTMASDTA